MQSITFKVEHCQDDKVGMTKEERVESDRIEEALSLAMLRLLESSWAPRQGEWLVVTAYAGPRYILGIPVSRRLLRRACERLWPKDAPRPEPHRMAAFRILTDGRATIRWSPLGLQVSRY